MTFEDLDPGEYCHQVEAYLCRKNDGHLIRLTGPSFTRVCGWATQGIPLNAVFRGIDRYFERYYAKGPRRRPVQIDFCEADVLDVFDEWRRAVGVFGVRPPGAADDVNGDERPSRHTSLPAHLERVITRLTTMRAGARLSPEADAAIDAAVRDVDGMRGRAAHARGDAREAIGVRLRDLDAHLVAVLRESLPVNAWDALEAAARADLSRFRASMPADAYERAVAASATRLLREQTGLPDVRYDD